MFILQRIEKNQRPGRLFKKEAKPRNKFSLEPLIKTLKIFITGSLSLSGIALASLLESVYVVKVKLILILLKTARKTLF